MIDLWPHWFRPWWLLLLPLLGWLLWQLWHRQKRAGRWQMLLPPAFHAVLLSGGNGRESNPLGGAWHGLAAGRAGIAWSQLATGGTNQPEAFRPVGRVAGADPGNARHRQPAQSPGAGTPQTV